RRRQQGEVVDGDRCGGGGGGGGGDWVFEAAGTTMSGGSSASSFFSSTSSLTDEDEDGDGVTSSLRPDRDVSSSSLSSLTSSGSDTTQIDGRPGRAALRAVDDAGGSSDSQDRAVQALSGEVPVLHMPGRCQLRGRPRQEDHPLHQKKEGAQALRP
ncbi:unnamed protein product, partial [Urochloa humidicola]